MAKARVTKSMVTSVVISAAENRAFVPSRHRRRALQVNDARSIQEHFGVRYEELRNLE